MPKGDKAFKPGQSGNPKGRPKGQLLFTKIKKENREQLLTAIQKALTRNMADNEAVALSSSVKGVDALMAAVLIKGVKTGSAMHANFFMLYSFGKPLDYDPSEDEVKDSASELAASLPSSVVTKVLRDFQHGQKKQSANAAQGS